MLGTICLNDVRVELGSSKSRLPMLEIYGQAYLGMHVIYLRQV